VYVLFVTSQRVVSKTYKVIKWKWEISDVELNLSFHISHIHRHGWVLGQTNFPKIRGPSQNSRRQNDEMQSLPFWRSTSIRQHRKQISRQGDLAPGIRAPLVKSSD